MPLTDTFIDTVVDTLRLRPLFSDSEPLRDPVRLGAGGNGFVVRGYVVITDGQGLARVHWLVVKGPLPARLGAGFTDPRVATPPRPLDQKGLAYEYQQRKGIGNVHGLGPVPDAVAWPVDLVLSGLPEWVRLGLELPAEVITLIVFKVTDQAVVDEPPWDLATFVQGPVATALELKNWCRIAHALGTALSAMHEKGWVHRDIKLANVVAQRRARGDLRSIELIDFGHADRFADYAEPGQRVCTGDAGTRQYWRPERLSAWQSEQSWWQASAVDEDVYAYASLLARVLLGRPSVGAGGGEGGPPDGYWAQEVEERVAELRGGPTEPADAIPRAIGQAFAELHELLTRPHAESFGPIDGFLKAVERIRLEADDGDGASNRFRSELANVPHLLAALGSHRVSCERYVSADRDAARLDCGVPASEAETVDVAVKFLRKGYVGLARTSLEGLLQGPRGVAYDAADARALRVYVGQILLREGDEGTGRAVLERYRARLHPEAPPTGLAWWIAMLTARLDFFVRAPVSVEGLDRPDLDERQRVWLLAFEVQQALRRRELVPHATREKLERAYRARSVSTSESLFLDMLLARCLSRAGDLVGALECLEKAAAVASRRHFPLEYASVQFRAAEALLDFGDRRRLEEARLVVDALLETAEERAIGGAELLHEMGVLVERDRAILVASHCAEAREGRAGVAAAACWHELADANARLSQRMSSVRRADLQALRDPPAGGAQPRYRHHGEALLKVWGTGGLCVEILDERGAPAAGAMLDTLLAEHAPGPPPSPVLVVGCGTGGDVLHLVAQHDGIPTLGVDAYAVNIRAASDRAGPSVVPGCPAFECVDLLQVDAEELGGARERPWNLVVMRETLADVTLKRSFLQALRRRVAPGTQLVLTDLVQCRPMGPIAWRNLLQRLGVPNLTTEGALCDDLQAANFAIERVALDDTGALRRFLAGRRSWFARSADPAAKALRDQPRDQRWVTALFANLIEAVDAGVLGWVRVRAKAVHGDPPRTAEGRRELPLSSRPPARAARAPVS